MPNLNEIVASLEEFAQTLGRAAELTQEQMVNAAAKLHDLETYLTNISTQSKNEDLRKFFNGLGLMANKLHHFAQDNTENVQYMHNLFKEAEQSAEATLGPIFQNIKNKSAATASTAANHDMSELMLGLPALGVSVFNHTKEVYNNFPNMTRNEKIVATAGVLLMFTGLGMLIAATANPVTCPVIAGILVIGVGIALCKYAVKRHNEQQLAAKAADVTQQLDSIEERYGHPKSLTKQTISFGSSSAAKAEKQEAKPEAEPSLLARLKNAFSNSKKDE
jgi:hypothetical protein